MPSGVRYPKRDVEDGALQLMFRWARRAATGQRKSERAVRMMVVPSCLVVFVHGILMDAEDEPFVNDRKVMVVARVA